MAGLGIASVYRAESFLTETELKVQLSSIYYKQRKDEEMDI